MNKVAKVICLMLCVVLIAGLFVGCGKNDKDKDVTQTKDISNQKGKEGGGKEGKDSEKTQINEELIEYTVLTVFEDAPSLAYDNPNDVVTPEIEKKFNIKVKDVMFNGGMTPIERLNMLVAAENVPDVVIIDNPNVPIAYATGAFADLTPYKDLLENTDVYVTDAGWKKVTVDGKLVALPADMSGGEIDIDHPQIADKVKKDIFYRRPGNWAMVANEDILKKAGYSFKTIKEVQDDLDKNPRNITYDDVKLEPEIKTVEDLETLLYKIKELDLKVDGKPVIPLSIPNGFGFHMSVLNAPTGGYYCNSDTMDVSGYLLNPGMKDFYKIWKKWYDDGILDKEYLIHKGEQYQEKCSSGRVAVMLPAFDINVVRDNLKEKNQDNDLRVIPWPESCDDHYIDASFPCGFTNIMINKNFKHTERLIKYFDWFQTEEGKELLTWGPESAGLWEMKDGKKVLKDNDLWETIRDGKKTDDGRDAEYYGIDGKSKAGKCAPRMFYNEAAIQRSYSPKFDAYLDTYLFISTEMLNREGTVLGPVGEKSNVPNAYFWSTVQTTKIPQLLSTKSDEEFDKVWNEIINDFIENGGYEEAIEEMKPAFHDILGK